MENDKVGRFWGTQCSDKHLKLSKSSVPSFPKKSVLLSFCKTRLETIIYVTFSESVKA